MSKIPGTTPDTLAEPSFFRQPPATTSAASGARRLIAGFALIIAIGTILLRLPIATTAPGSISWVDAFFTSTSAVTVTGLTVVSTAETFTIFGQLIILLLLQVGGIGFISLSIVLFMIAGRHVGLQERLLLRQTLGVGQASNIVRFTLYVLGVVVGLELVGALLLFVRWSGVMEPGPAAYLALFHAVSAFCNAGFDLYGGTELPVLFGFGQDPWSLGVLAGLIVIGGIGITVVSDLVTWPVDRRLSVHTRMTLVVTLVLTLVGSIILLADEQVAGQILPALPVEERLYTGLFTVISSRTAGITILPLDQLTQASQLILMVWMFIGGAPSSMAGGVSTTTLAVIAVAMRATVAGQPQAVTFQRSLTTETIMKAVAVMTVSTLVVASVTLLLVLLRAGDLFVVGFETVSAFSNTGYSLGITGQLSPIARVVIAFIMFWGRLGPLSLVVVLAQRQRPSRLHYPEEKVILG
jgi:trk system potassium uptake protein TrkH